MLTSVIALALIAQEPGHYARAFEKGLEFQTASIILKDTERKKDLPLRITWPKPKGKYPVIIWSHGMYGSKDNYGAITDTWVKAGYVVIQPTHGDSISLMTEEQRRALLRNPNTNNTASWRERPGDISLIIDRLGELEDRVSDLKGKLDRSKIGMGGHSFGAWTTQVVAGCSLAGGIGTSMSDPRPKAFIALSGQGPSALMPREGFASLKRPMLWATGDKDTSRGGESPQWRKQAFELAAPGDKFLLWIKDAAHNFGGMTSEAKENNKVVIDFLNRAGSSANNNPEHVKLTQSATLAFWDAYVRGDAAALQYLKEKKIEAIPGATLSIR